MNIGDDSDNTKIHKHMMNSGSGYCIYHVISGTDFVRMCVCVFYCMVFNYCSCEHRKLHPTGVRRRRRYDARMVQLVCFTEICIHRHRCDGDIKGGEWISLKIYGVLPTNIYLPTRYAVKGSMQIIYNP